MTTSRRQVLKAIGIGAASLLVGTACEGQTSTATPAPVTASPPAPVVQDHATSTPVFPTPTATSMPTTTPTPSVTPTMAPTITPSPTSTIEPTATPEPILYSGDVECRIDTYGDLGWDIILNEGYPNAEEARKRFCLRVLAHLEYASRTPFNEVDPAVALDPDVGRQLEMRMGAENLSFMIPGVAHEDRDNPRTPITYVEVRPHKGIIFEIVGAYDDTYQSHLGTFGMTLTWRWQITSDSGQLHVRIISHRDLWIQDGVNDGYGHQMVIASLVTFASMAYDRSILTDQNRAVLYRERATRADRYSEQLLFLPAGGMPYDGVIVHKYWGNDGDELRIPLFLLRYDGD
jgi:hypothetical protein